VRAFLPFVLLGASSIPAQGVLSTPYQTNYFLSSHDGGVYFDLSLHKTIQLHRLDLNLISPPGGPGQLEVFVRPGTWAGHVGTTGDWTCLATASFTAAGHMLPTPCPLSQPIGLPPGDYGIALHVQGAMPAYHFAYAPVTCANADLSLTAGGSALLFLASTPYVTRVFSGSLHYSYGGGPYAAAAATPFGQGCNRRARSFHETFAPGGFDLAGQRLVLSLNGEGGYDVARLAGAPLALATNAQDLGLARGGAAFVALASPLPFPGGATSTLLVLADGRVLFTGNGLLSNAPVPPAVPTLFAGPPGLAVAWQDYAPAGQAGVHVTTDPASGAVTVIWWQLPAHGAPGSSSTFALTARVDGTLELCFGTVANPGACLVGFAAGPGARDPGPCDLSAAGWFRSATDDPGLGLCTVGRPVLGAGMRLAVTGAPPASAGALGFAFAGGLPAVDLTPFGAPGCQLYLDPATMVWRGLGTGRELPLLLPSCPPLLGCRCHAQAMAWQPAANALGLVTSNGVELVLGTL
jgi:hypothetical protein